MGCGNSKVQDADQKAAPLLKPWKERKCRDIFWLILFVAFWVGNVGIFIITSQSGDAARLLYATDAFGNQCGGKDAICAGGQPCGKYITYPRVEKDFAQAVMGGTDLNDPTQVLAIPFFGLCISSCPEGFEDVNGDGVILDFLCDYNLTDYMNEVFPNADPLSDAMILSSDAKEAYNQCRTKYGSIPFPEAFLSNEEKVTVAGKEMTVRCKDIVSSCFRFYVSERSLFFRCVPESTENSNCTSSPYIEKVLNKNPTEYPSTNSHCGTCLDPVYDAAGLPMDPGSKECKAKTVTANTQTTSATPNPIFDQVNTWSAFLVRAMGDITLTSDWILITGVGGAIALSAVWLLLLRYFAGVFVWTVIWSLLLCFTFLTFQFLIYGGVIQTTTLSSLFSAFSSDTNSTSAAADTIVNSMDIFNVNDQSAEKNYRIAGYIMCGVTGVYLLLVIFLSRKIRLAVQILKEATKVIAAMPFIMLFPIGTVSFSVGLGVYWVFVSMLISSSGEISAKVLEFNYTDAIPTLTNRRLDVVNNITASLGNTIVNEFQSSSLNTWLWVYNFFGFLWTNQLVQAVSACTIAGAVCDYYWASEFENEKSKKMGRLPVWRSFLRTMRFHLGSLIFGSFIIAVIQLIRAALAYLDKQTQSLQKSNRVVKILMKVVQCCLWCFEKILKFITKHAYIQIALKGSSFCTATKDGFLLILNNLAKVGVLTAINNLIMLFAKLVIAVGSGVLCWLSVNQFYTGDNAPSSVITPTLVSGILSWYIGSLFMSVYALSVDTILVCFCEDESHNDGSVNKPYYMSNALKRIAKKSNKIFKSQQAERKASNDEEEEDPQKSSANLAPSQKQLL